MMYREQWTLSLVASTATTTTATNHHNKNKPQKNNFLPKLTPADADLVQVDCSSSYEGARLLQGYRVTAQYWIVSSVAGLSVRTWCLVATAPFLKWQTDFSQPRLSYLSAYSRSSTILFISCPSDCNLGNPYLGMWPLKLLCNREDEAWQRKMNYFLHCCMSFRRFQLYVLS